MRRFLPKSLLGQMLLSVALALLVAQTISAVLQYRGAEQRREMRHHMRRDRPAREAG